MVSATVSPVSPAVSFVELTALSRSPLESSLGWIFGSAGSPVSGPDFFADSEGPSGLSTESFLTSFVTSDGLSPPLGAVSFVESTASSVLSWAPSFRSFEVSTTLPPASVVGSLADVEASPVLSWASSSASLVASTVLSPV